MSGSSIVQLAPYVPAGRLISSAEAATTAPNTAKVLKTKTKTATVKMLLRKRCWRVSGWRLLLAPYVPASHLIPSAEAATTAPVTAEAWPTATVKVIFGKRCGRVSGWRWLHALYVPAGCLVPSAQPAATAPATASA